MTLTKADGFYPWQKPKTFSKKSTGTGTASVSYFCKKDLLMVYVYNTRTKFSAGLQRSSLLTLLSRKTDF